MRGQLDLRNCGCAIREKYFDCLVIPVETGNHYTDIDVVMSELPDSAKERIRWRCRRKIRKLIKEVGGDTREQELLPTGFNLKSLPTGATLTFNEDNNSDG